MYRVLLVDDENMLLDSLEIILSMNDMEIIGRVHELSERYGVSMSQIALAWHFSKGVTAPIVGGSKISHLEEAIGAVDIELKPDDIRYLEEPYRAHEVVGALQE